MMNEKKSSTEQSILDAALTSKNMLYFLTAIVLFLLLKLGFTFANNDSLMFLLLPTDKLVGLLTGSHSAYLADSGYFHNNLNIVIDKSCSGFNFWVLCFLVFTFLTVRHLDKPLRKIQSIPAALICAYLLTIFVNTSRIFASLIVQSQTKNILQNQQHLVHQAVGITVNVTFLVLAYYLIDKFFKNKQYYAKLA
jgi:exosortase K